jgi:hypothetical protein
VNLRGCEKMALPVLFKAGILSQNFPGGTEKDHEKLQSDSQYPGLNFNP